MYRLLRYVPKNHLSRTVGRLVHTRLPRPIARRLVHWFARSYEIDLDAAAKPAHEYPSIGHFFIRDLREGLRPIESDLVSPVDGTLRAFGLIENGRLEQVKGKSYTVARFLDNDADAQRYISGGTFFNLYLSPQDYHHVHAPVGGNIVRSVLVPGKLWPVNDWSMENIDELFSVNERIVTYIDCEYGRVAVVMIGATNVGKMTVTYDSFISNAGQTKTTVRDYSSPIAIQAGDRLGTFHMGSSVVMLFEPGRIDLTRVRLEPKKKTRYGMAVLHSKS
ncbi:MAG: archaetidylserine decarboxylase [Thermoanaerobaculia bacterium]